MEENKPVIKYSSYTPAQKKATQKYRENNKEKVNEQRKKYYQTRKEKDPNFLEYKRLKAKEYYLKKKSMKKPEEVKEEVKEEPKEEVKEIQYSFLPKIEEEKQKEVKEELKEDKEEKPRKKRVKLSKPEPEREHLNPEVLKEIFSKMNDDKTKSNKRKYIKNKLYSV